MANRILVVDDDPDITDIVQTSLAAEGFIVSAASSVDAALDAIRAQPPTLAILDIEMETYDAGHRLCRAIRSEFGIPIIFLTSRSTDIDAVVALELGADDYVTKPFSPRELAARVRAVLRRGEPVESAAQPDAAPASALQDIGEFVVDGARLSLAAPGGQRGLSRIEFVILRTLAANYGAVFSREEIIKSVYGSADSGTSPRTIDSHIRRLRAKMNEIGDDPIDTVRGVGYRLRDPQHG